jgi:hypothetical protein
MARRGRFGIAHGENQSGRPHVEQVALCFASRNQQNQYGGKAKVYLRCKREMSYMLKSVLELFWRRVARVCWFKGLEGLEGKERKASCWPGEIVRLLVCEVGFLRELMSDRFGEN